MLIVNKIDESCYVKHSNNVSFQSKFVPNSALKHTFEETKNDIESAVSRSSGYFMNLEFAESCLRKSKLFALIIENLLNDGKEDLIKVTMNKGYSCLFINNHKVNKEENKYMYKELPRKNILNYFYKRLHLNQDKYILSNEEFKLIQQEINVLNFELNADDVTKNPLILNNLNNNIGNIIATLAKYTQDKLKNFEDVIFK